MFVTHCVNITWDIQSQKKNSHQIRRTLNWAVGANRQRQALCSNNSYALSLLIKVTLDLLACSKTTHTKQFVFCTVRDVSTFVRQPGRQVLQATLTLSAIPTAAPVSAGRQFQSAVQDSAHTYVTRSHGIVFETVICCTATGAGLIQIPYSGLAKSPREFCIGTSIFINL
jgi:hypothetical protein